MDPHYRMLREQGAELREAIVKVLREQGAATADEVAAELGRDKDQIKNYLCRLVKANRASVERLKGRTGRPVVARYHFVQPDDDSDSDALQRPVLKTWAPCTVRDPYALDPAFFGRAAA